jgi:putative tricarboxylic transport membrane protein
MCTTLAALGPTFRVTTGIAVGIAVGIGLAAWPGSARGAAPDPPVCIAPAKAGGGFDLTCQLAEQVLRDARMLHGAWQTRYLPGGIGALAWQHVQQRQPADGHALVAFSGGSLLNLAQGRFGPYGVRDVRWVASLGIDHGVLAVRRDSPFRSLADLMTALQRNPGGVVFGAGGTIGSQDWFKTALLARAAGVSHKALRFVAFEGGGDAFGALQGGHVQVVAGDAGEVGQMLAAGAPIRLLAVLSGERLAGQLAAVPTAGEQGHDLRWPIVRGFYVGPQVSDADYSAWVEAFASAMAAPGYAARRTAVGLIGPSLTGADLQAEVEREVTQYKALAREFGLMPPR